MPLRDGDKTVEFNCEVRAATEKALYIYVWQGKNKVGPMWVPKSQLAAESEIGDDAKEGDTGSIEMSEWIAEQKELL